MKSILKSWRWDASLFFIPALLVATLCVLPISFLEHPPFLLWNGVLFFIFYVIDAGHTVSTGFRVFRKWDDESLYCIFLIILIFVLNLILAFWNPILLFRIYLYASFFHHLRQYWGLTAWYQKLNGRFHKFSQPLSQILPLLPFVAYHFNPGSSSGGLFLKGGEFLLYPSLLFYKITLFIFAFLFIYAIYIEVECFRKYGFEGNRVMSVFFPSFVHALVFCFTSPTYAIAALIIGHGVTYFVIIGLSIERITGKTLSLKIIMSMVSLALLTGLCIFYFDNAVDAVPPVLSPFAYNVVTACLALPALWHYAVDSFIWKSSHKEAKLIYERAV